MKNVLVLGVAALALVGCGTKEEVVPAPAGCTDTQTVSVNDNGEQVCVDAPAAEAPAAEAAVEAAPAAEAPVAEVAAEAAPAEAAK